MTDADIERIGAVIEAKVQVATRRLLEELSARYECKYVRAGEAAQMLAITPRTLRRWRASGKIRGELRGAHWRYEISEIERVRAANRP